MAATSSSRLSSSLPGVYLSAARTSGTPSIHVRTTKRCKQRMQAEQKKRLMELCELAVNEEQPEKLLKIVEEMNQLLDELQAEARPGVHRRTG
jgi:uncharacterized FlaG/YvyC family protein